MSRPSNVLILCTGNSARSILAEAILNRCGDGKYRAYSAGSKPQGTPHPLAVELLQSLGYDTGFARSKSWDEFAGDDSPRLDFVITVCDLAAAEECPYWPGSPATAHWGLPDPAVAKGSLQGQRAAFREAYDVLQSRVEAFISASPDPDAPRDALKDQLAAIGLIGSVDPAS